VIIELQEQLVAQERELNNQKGCRRHVGGRINDLCVGTWGSDASRARTDVVWWDFST
jgi:hypothetical protein